MNNTSPISYEVAKAMMVAFEEYQESLDQKGETLKVTMDLIKVQEFINNAVNNGDSVLNIYLAKYHSEENTRNTIILNTSSTEDDSKDYNNEEEFGLNDGNIWP